MRALAMSNRELGGPSPKSGKQKQLIWGLPKPVKGLYLIDHEQYARKPWNNEVFLHKNFTNLNVLMCQRAILQN
jgi:hypothetical protein